jgi:hypothetical protein
MKHTLSPIILALCATAACGSAGPAATTACPPNTIGYDPPITAADFSTTIDNRYLAYRPGSSARYRQSAGEIVQVDVTSDIKMAMGVATRVVHDFMRSPSGQLLEDTYDYFAQDRAGNVWYFGEDTKAYVGTQVSPAGSWLAGVACARPGIVMKANPQVGDRYHQEYLEGEAEDEAEVVGVAEPITVPFGTFAGCLKTKESTRLAPGDLENKYYCPGVFGPVSSIDVGEIDAGNREDLVSVDGKTAP